MKFRTLSNVFGAVVMLDVECADKKEIISKMVVEICKKAGLGKKLQSTLLSKVLTREELGSTGIGAGAAVPHAKVQGVKNLLGAFARSAHPIDYDAVDGEPVQLFFLLISPQEATAGYLEALSSLSRALRERKFCNFLRAAENKSDVLYTLNEILLSSRKED